MQKILSKLRVLSAVFLFSICLAIPAGVMASTSGAVCKGANNLAISDTAGDCNIGDQTGKVNNLVEKIINIFSAIVGVVAVIMIVYGGFRYITSGGDTTRVSSAKNTIIYALIGLAIVALAQVIVRFVLHTATAPAAPACINHKIDSGPNQGKPC